MCKVLIIPHIKKDKQELVDQIAFTASKFMGKFPDNDGFGYAEIDSEGHIYGERWENPENAFLKRETLNPNIAKLSAVFGKALLSKDSEPEYEEFGGYTSKRVAMMLHSRKVTKGEKCLSNTHPFYIVDEKNTEGIALIHNGTIVNHEKLTKKFSTCDSETILHEYMKYGINYVPENIQSMVTKLIGVYTVGILSSFWDEKQNVIQPYVDIFKSNKELVCSYIDELDAPIFATTEEIIKSVCEELKLTYSPAMEVNDGYFIRINPITGELLTDLISFTLSKQWDNVTYTEYNQDTKKLPGGPHKVEKVDLLEDIKSTFEENHPELFTDEYYEDLELTPREKNLWEQLERSGEHTHRALKLVQMTMGVA